MYLRKYTSYCALLMLLLASHLSLSADVTLEDLDFIAPTSCADVGEIAKFMHQQAQDTDDSDQFLEFSAAAVGFSEEGFKEERNFWMAQAITLGRSPTQAHDDFERKIAPIRKSAFLAVTTAWEWREKSRASFFLHINSICNGYS